MKMACRFADVFVVRATDADHYGDGEREEVDRIAGLVSALTTTFQNRLTRVNCWPVFVRCCVVRRTNCQAHRHRKRR
ncbi:hypothetical protein ACLB1M_26730 [Escherichia coli]